MNPTPRIRAELKAMPAEENGIKYFDVKDPHGGSMRLYDFEWLIAQHMDGSRPFDEVATWARERLSVSPSPADLAAFAAKLRELGFFDVEGEMTPLPPPSPAELAAEDARSTLQLKVQSLADVDEDEDTAMAATFVGGSPPAGKLPPPARPVEKPAPAPSAPLQSPTPPSLAMQATLPTPTPAPVPAPAKPAPVPGPSTVASIQAASPMDDTPARKSSAVSTVIVILILLGIGGAVGYMKFMRPQAAHVTVVLASPREVVRLYDGAGTVKKSEGQTLAFGEAGKVSDVVAKGTEVKAGTPVATLESYAAIEKQLTDLKDREVFYGKQLEAAKAKNDEAGAKAAEGKVAEKRKMIGELDARAAKVRLLASSTGTVSEVLVQAGGQAQAGSPAVKIGDKHLNADFKVDAGGPKAGDAVQVQAAAGGAPIAGKVTQAQNGSVTVELPDGSPVKPGDQLRLVKKTEANVIPVPASAVLQRDGKDVVFVLSGGEAHARPVAIVDRSAAEVLVSSSSLAPGDSVITSGAESLKDGDAASAQ